MAYDGTLNLSAASSDLYVSNGIAFTGSNGSGAGTVLDTGNGSTLNITGTTTLSNVTIDIGNASCYSYLEAPERNGVVAVLTLGSTASLVQTGKYALLSNSGQPQSGVVNQGTISAGVKSGVFDIQGTSFSNQATVAVSNGDTLDIQSTTFTNTGTVTVASGGTLEIGGTFNNTGYIDANTGGTILLDGTMAQLSGTTLTGGTYEVDCRINAGAAEQQRRSRRMVQPSS